MLDTKTLCARVTTPARSKPRSLNLTAQSRKWADQLRESGHADKTTTRVITDGLLAVLEYLTQDGKFYTDDMELLEAQMAYIDGNPTVKVQLSMSDAHWDAVDRLAAELRVCPSKVVRVVSHVAMEQVYNELSGR